MDAVEANQFEDLWRVEDPLPGPDGLRALARRCGEIWQASELADRVRIGYNQRMRTTLGRARLKEGAVELNIRLLRAHPGEFLQTLVHELAHLVVYLRHGAIRPHGQAFHLLMAAAGMPGAATHNLPIAHLRRRRAAYLYLHCCSGCGMTFLARRTRRNCFCRACGPGMSWTIIRAPATAAGRAVLQAHARAAASGRR